MSEPRRRCTTCSTDAVENGKERWLCPEDPDHPLRWSARVDVYTPEGRRRRLRGTFATRAEADDWLAEQRMERRTGSAVEPSKITFGVFVSERWLPWLEASGLRESTVQSYRDVLKYAKPLDAVPLQSITSDRLSLLYAELRRSGGRRGQGLSPRTVRYCHTVVGKALKDAVRWKLIRHSPAQDADVPSAKSTRSRAAESEAWSGEQVADFFGHVGDDRLRALWWFLARTGARRSEALGLHWDRVDLDAGYVVITRTRTSVNHKVVEEDKTKTSRSRRRISLDAETVAVLRDWRRRQLEERMAFAGGWTDTGHVFTREDGVPWHPDWISRLFSAAVKRSGLPPIPLKGLRHSSATVALEAGVHPKVVQERLGHSSISITLDIYSHVAEGMDKEAAEQIARLMGRR